jgi:hypothetical protein
MAQQQFIAIQLLEKCPTSVVSERTLPLSQKSNPDPVQTAACLQNQCKSLKRAYRSPLYFYIPYVGSLPSPPSRAEVKNTVELYLCPP